MSSEQLAKENQWLETARELFSCLAIQYQDAQPPFYRWKYNPAEPPLRLWQSGMQALDFAKKDVLALFSIKFGNIHGPQYAIENLRKFAHEAEMQILLWQLERNEQPSTDIFLRSRIQSLAVEGRTFLSETHTSEGNQLNKDTLLGLHTKAVKTHAQQVLDDLQLTYVESRRGPIHEADFKRMLTEAELDISSFTLRDGQPFTYEKLAELNKARDSQQYQHEMCGPGGIGQDAVDLLEHMEKWARAGSN